MLSSLTTACGCLLTAWEFLLPKGPAVCCSLCWALATSSCGSMPPLAAAIEAPGWAHKHHLPSQAQLHTGVQLVHSLVALLLNAVPHSLYT